MSIVEALAEFAWNLVGNVHKTTFLDAVLETETYEPFVTAWFDPEAIDELVG